MRKPTPYLWLITQTVLTLVFATHRSEAAVGEGATSPQTVNMLIQVGHSGAWYNPARNGEGWIVEINSENSAVIYWYTFDRGLPLWMVGSSQFSPDDTTLTFEAWSGYGGWFGAQFDPADVSLVQRRPITLRFADCNHGEVEHEGRVYPVERLAPVLGASCGEASSTAVSRYANQSGAWFNPARNGEGFSLQWWAEDQAIATWFTYTPLGDGPIWIVGAGQRIGDAIEFPEMFTASGAQFGAAFNPDDVELTPWGRLRLELNCGHGIAHYEGRGLYGTGDIELTQLTSIAGLGDCRSTVGLTDVYEISFEELPADGDVQIPRDRHAIDNDGKLYGFDANHRLVRSASLDAPAEVLAEGPVGSIAAINHDGSRMVLNHAWTQVGATMEPLGNPTPMIWTREAGLEALPLPYARAGVEVVSQDLTSYAGSSYKLVGNSWQFDQLWVLAPSGLRTLSTNNLNQSFNSVSTTAISNDGSMVFGERWMPYLGWTGSRTTGLQWDASGAFRTLTDVYRGDLGPILACDATCELNFGAGIADDHDAYLLGRRMWIGRAGALTSWTNLPSDAADRRLRPKRLSDDGAILVGQYSARTNIPVPGGDYPFVWTPETDVVSVLPLLVELGLTDIDWQHMDVAAVSANGEHILVTGIRALRNGPDGHFLPIENRAGHIRLRRR